MELDASLAKVVSASQRYHPYAYGNKSRTTTIGRSKQQFFRGALSEVGGHGRAKTSHLNILKALQRAGLDKVKATLPTISPIEEILKQLPPPLTAFKLLDLDVSLIATYRLTPVGGRLLPFAHNWEMLTRDPWVLTTVRGYHLPLCQWPIQAAIAGKFTLDSKKEEALAEEISNSEVKEAVAPPKKHQVHLISPLFVVPKSGGGWRPIIDLAMAVEPVYTV